MYKVGKYILNEKRLFEFIEMVCKDLNIEIPKYYFINDKYSKEFIEQVHQYSNDYIKNMIKSDCKFVYNEPKIELHYINENGKLVDYKIDDIEDTCLFLGKYHVNENEVYINLNLIYMDIALHCLTAKKRGFPHYYLTERKISVSIKKTIMHELYHSYQKQNNLNFDCIECDKYAMDTIKEKKFLNINILEEF